MAKLRRWSACGNCWDTTPCRKISTLPAILITTRCTMKLEDLQAKALQNRPDFRAAQQGVTAAKSQYELAKANGKVDVTGTFDYDHVSATNTGSFFGSFQIPIFNRNQGEIARTNYVINQAQEQELAASDQVMSDVLTAYEGVRENDKVVHAVPRRLSGCGAAVSRHHRVFLQARRRQPARLSGCRAQLSRDSTSLPPVARVVSHRGRTTARGSGNQEPAMSTRVFPIRLPNSSNARARVCDGGRNSAACLAGCSSDERANQMTSFSGKESKSATPELFTIPAESDVSRAGGDCRACRSWRAFCDSPARWPTTHSTPRR